MAQPQDNTAAPAGRKPMSRSEVARHASLVRWGKKQPFAARLAAIREKRKKGGGKAKKPPVDKAAEKEKKQADNRNLVKQTMMDGDVGLAPKAFDNLMGLGKGENPDETGAAGLIKMGMAEQGTDGTLRLTANGRAAIAAANRGDAKAAIDAVSRGVERAGKKEAAAAPGKEGADATPEGEEEEAKPAGGGGGGGGKKEESKEEKEKAKAAEREKTAAATAPKAGLEAADVDALRAAANEGGAANDALLALGLIDEAGDATDQGRRALTALEKGNVASYRAAVQDAKGRLGREQAKGEREKAKEAATAERTAQQAAQEAARTARRERLQNISLRRLEAGGKLSDSARVDLEDAGLLDEAGELTDEARRRIGKKSPIEKGRETKMEHIDTLLALVEELVDVEIKAGARHSAGDTAMLQAIYDSAEQICELAEQLGAQGEDEGEEEEQPPAMKGIELFGNDLAALPGYAVKAVGDGWTSGYLVKFGGDGDLSQWRDVFGRETDYGRATKSDVWVHHRMLPGVGKRRLTHQADIGVDDEGVFIKHLLDLRSAYEAKLYGLVQAGKLGWSSGTAPHLVERKALGDGRHAIEQWPLGLDASYTPTPAGGLVVNAGAMKGLMEEAGIDLINLVHSASIADSGIKHISDSQEALPDVDGERHDGAQATSERARRLFLQSRILQLQE